MENRNGELAKNILSYYLQELWRGTGLIWSPDNQEDIEQAVDELINAAVSRMTHETTQPATTLGTSCPECGGCEWYCAECQPEI